jgi:hypothetical protein
VRASLIVLTIAFLFLGGLFVLIGGRALLDAWHYRQAIRAEAVATTTALRVATDTSGTEYEVSYRAGVEGQVQERTEIVPVHVWERAESGAPVPVEYQPGRPDTVRVATGAPATPSLLSAAIGAVMILGGLAAGARAARWQRPPADAPPPAPPIVVPARESSYWPRARQSAEFWLGATFLVVSTPFVIMSLVQIVEEARFARSGISTDGMILAKAIKGSGRSQRSRTYEATYRVTVPEGAFENRVRLSYDAWLRLKERQSIEVMYLPERPATSRLRISREWTGAAVLALVAGVFFPVGATLLRRSIRRARLAWGLEHRGAAAKGVIVGISDRRLEINEVRQFRLTYEYDDFQARRHTATHDLPEDEAQLWNVGDAGAVRYDPGRPADAFWLGRNGTV